MSTPRSDRNISDTQIIEAVSSGLLNKQIARKFGINRNAVAKRISEIGISSNARSLKGSNNPNWNGGTHLSHGYVRRKPSSESDYMPVHRLIAERAMGKPLGKSVVHHVDFNPSNNANSNLVICQDQAYHLHLHARARAMAAGIDPNTHKRCSSGRHYESKALFKESKPSYDGLRHSCWPCEQRVQRARTTKRKSALAWARLHGLDSAAGEGR